MRFKDLLKKRYPNDPLHGALLIEYNLYVHALPHVTEEFITDWSWDNSIWYIENQELFAWNNHKEGIYWNGAEEFFLAKLKEPYLTQYKAAIAERTVMNL